MNEPSAFMQMYANVMVFFLGACWGSFLNVCIYRIPEELSVVKPRSRCPVCLKMIAWYDNIPMLSWLLLRGRCRACKTGISPRYFLVELLTAVLFLLVWLRYGFAAVTPIYWLMVFGLVLATFIDFDHFIIPDRVSIGGMLLGPVLSVLAPSLHGEEAWWPALLASLIGLAAGYGSLRVVGIVGTWLFKKDAMGLGDVKLLGALGAFLGWQAVIFVILVSSLLGSVVGIGLIVSGRGQWSGRIPYGPYIALAAVIWALGGDAWWAWYAAWVTGQ